MSSCGKHQLVVQQPRAYLLVTWFLDRWFCCRNVCTVHGCKDRSHTSLVPFRVPQLCRENWLACRSFFGQWGPNATTWLLPSELFPTETRAMSHGLAAATGKVRCFVMVYPACMATVCSGACVGTSNLILPLMIGDKLRQL